jgi:hypothetical protein
MKVSELILEMFGRFRSSDIDKFKNIPDYEYIGEREFYDNIRLPSSFLLAKREVKNIPFDILSKRVGGKTDHHAFGWQQQYHRKLYVFGYDWFTTNLVLNFAFEPNDIKDRQDDANITLIVFDNLKEYNTGIVSKSDYKVFKTNIKFKDFYDSVLNLNLPVYGYNSNLMKKYADIIKKMIPISEFNKYDKIHHIYQEM